MGSPADKVLDAEQDRQQRVDELATENGPDWAKDYQPGSMGCHELLDRTSVAARYVEENLLEHPACTQNPHWFALAEQAVAALNELYQQIGAEHLSADAKP